MNADPSGRFYGIASMCYLIVMGGGYDPMCAEAPPPTDPEPRVGGGSRMGDKLIYKDPVTGTYMSVDTSCGDNVKRRDKPSRGPIGSVEGRSVVSLTEGSADNDRAQRRE
jgi:hypothetical protein